VGYCFVDGLHSINAGLNIHLWKKPFNKPPLLFFSSEYMPLRPVVINFTTVILGVLGISKGSGSRFEVKNERMRGGGMAIGREYICM
jgi:hypothetical protein